MQGGARNINSKAITSFYAKSRKKAALRRFHRGLKVQLSKSCWRGICPGAPLCRADIDHQKVKTKKTRIKLC